jgi:hypothetical protein
MTNLLYGKPSNLSNTRKFFFYGRYGLEAPWLSAFLSIKTRYLSLSHPLRGYYTFSFLEIDILHHGPSGLEARLQMGIFSFLKQRRAEMRAGKSPSKRPEESRAESIKQRCDVLLISSCSYLAYVRHWYRTLAF